MNRKISNEVDLAREVSMPTEVCSTATKSEYLSIDELAEIHGLTHHWIRYQVFTKQIPYYKFSRLIRFKRSEIEDWIQKRKIEESGIE